MQTRVYVPLTVAALRRLGSSGAIGPAPVVAHAVTTDLRREHPAADLEELEYRAFLESSASGRQRARVVAAADVEAGAVVEDPAAGHPVSAVRVSVPIARSWIASFHVAVAAGSPDYSWYDATELEVVLEIFG